MSGLDLFEDGFPHSTREGYDRGCRGHACPGLVEHGFSCADANVRHHGDYAYLKRVEAGLSPAEIAAADRAVEPVKRVKPRVDKVLARVIEEPTVTVADSVQPREHLPAPVEVKSKPGPARSPIPHGTQAGYQRGCRDGCPGDASGKTCRTAASEYQREYKERRAANGGQPLVKVSAVTAVHADEQGLAPESVLPSGIAERLREEPMTGLPIPSDDVEPALRENVMVRFARWLGVMPL